MPQKCKTRPRPVNRNGALKGTVLNTLVHNKLSKGGTRSSSQQTVDSIAIAKQDDNLSIPDTSSESMSERGESPREDHEADSTQGVKSQYKEDECAMNGTGRSQMRDRSGSDVSPSSRNLIDESLVIPSSALAEKARKIMERELMLEKVLAQSKADLQAIEEQINDLGHGYVAVSRSISNRTARRRIEIPDLPPSPISDRCGERVRTDNPNDRSLDEIDANFSKVLRSTPPSNRPPLAPVIPSHGDEEKAKTRLSLSKPLLTNVPVRRTSLGN